VLAQVLRVDLLPVGVAAKFGKVGATVWPSLISVIVTPPKRKR